MTKSERQVKKYQVYSEPCTTNWGDELVPPKKNARLINIVFKGRVERSDFEGRWLEDTYEAIWVVPTYEGM